MLNSLSPDDDTFLDNPKPYREVVISLVYLIITRPNIQFVVHVVSQFSSVPHTTH